MQTKTLHMHKKGHEKVDPKRVMGERREYEKMVTNSDAKYSWPNQGKLTEQKSQKIG